MNKTTKLILSVIGTIIIGAIGSGFWELCLHDCFNWIGRCILSGITLGITSVRDSFYEEVAKGRTNSPVIYLVSLTFLLPSFFLGFFIGMRPNRRSRNATEEPSESEVRHKRIWWVGFLGIMLLTFLLMFRYVSVSYVSGAVDNFEQTFTVCLPYLTTDERDEIRSKFAQVRTKDDYIAIMDRLKSNAVKNKLKIPNFSVW